MVGVFASLKWRLVTSRLRATSGGTRAGILVGLGVLAVVLGFIVFGLVSLRLVPQVAQTFVVTLFVLQAVAWAIAPMVAFGVDETVDPAKFSLLPLRAPTLQRGLLVASLIGLLPACNLIVLIGAALAISDPWSVLPVALVAAVLQLMLCVVLSRALSTSLSALMSSRRGRDLGLIVGVGIFALYMGFTWTLNRGDGAGLATGATALASALAWSPPGALARLPLLVAQGAWLEVGAAVLVAAAGLGLAWWWWSAALRRSLTTVPSMTSSSAPAGEHQSTTVGVGLLGTARVVAQRDRLLIWRDPMRRAAWLVLLVLAIGWPFIVIGHSGALYAVTLAALLVGAQAGNIYAIDGSALWLHMMIIADRTKARGEALGHALAAGVLGIVVVLVSLLALAAVYDDWELLPGAIGLCLSAVLGSLAVALYLSARLPYAVPQSRKSMFASSVAGQKGRTAVATLALMVGGAVLALPAAGFVVAAHVVNPIWGWVGLVVGPVIAFAAVWFALGRTADLFLETEPEILDVVRAGDRV